MWQSDLHSANVLQFMKFPVEISCGLRYCFDMIIYL